MKNIDEKNRLIDEKHQSRIDLSQEVTRTYLEKSMNDIDDK
jgi:hypothetical protein